LLLLLLACMRAAAYGSHVLPARTPIPRVSGLVACASPPLNGHTPHTTTMDVPAAAGSSLLDALDGWLRLQTIESILPRDQAKALLADLRDDRRFWAQQRKQYNVLWISIEQGIRAEDRPLAAVLGPTTSSQLIDALEDMDEDPALVNAVLRSEVVERLLGHVLYEGIFEFIERADLLGAVFKQLPLLAAIRMQMLTAARSQLDTLLGEQLARFLGEYTASAAESASTYLLSDDLAGPRRRARRAAAEKLLSKPIGELVAVSDLEMALVRDTVWSAVQDFRLPAEEDLVDRLYAQFGEQPFSILLPSQTAASRGDAPLYERGRSVLKSILARFVVSNEWRAWSRSEGGAALLAESIASPLEEETLPPPPPAEAPPPRAPPKPLSWDGWD